VTDPAGDLDALIVGAGFSGFYVLRRLRADGFVVRLAVPDGVALLLRSVDGRRGFRRP
jgi:uncharacterized protein YbjT (DUF2867 family)